MFRPTCANKVYITQYDRDVSFRTLLIAKVLQRMSSSGIRACNIGGVILTGTSNAD
jgi:hypothetical protein